MPTPIVTAYPPHLGPRVWRPGDVIFTHNQASWHSRQGFVSGLIVTGEWIRFHKERSATPKPWRVSHVACVGEGHLVEALGHGVVRSPLDKYNESEYLYVATDLDDSERRDCVDFWESMVGTKYGYLSVVSAGFQLTTGLHVGITNGSHVICSGLATAGLGIFKYRSNPSMVSPTELLIYHDIHITNVGAKIPVLLDETGAVISNHPSTYNKEMYG